MMFRAIIVTQYTNRALHALVLGLTLPLHGSANSNISVFICRIFFMKNASLEEFLQACAFLFI
jgi:hypothetical protein